MVFNPYLFEYTIALILKTCYPPSSSFAFITKANLATLNFTYLEMSLREFSSVMNESHMAIKKWEDFKNQPTRMDKNIEIMLRLYLYEKIILSNKNALKKKQNFYSHFVKIRDTLTHHTN